MKLKFTKIENNYFHSSYIQYFKGIKVESPGFAVVGQNGIALAITGEIFKDVNVNTTNLVDKNVALQKVLATMPNNKFKWNNQMSKEDLYEVYDDSLISFLPTSELVIIKDFTNDNFKCCWKFMILVDSPSTKLIAFVDANNNEIYRINTDEDHYQYKHDGTGDTWYNGFFNNLGTRTCNLCSNYSLSSDLSPNYIKTCYIGLWGNSYIVKDNNNDWIENSYGSSTNRKTAHSAQWAGERCYEYYLNSYSRVGMDFQGSGLRLITENPNTNLLGSYTDGNSDIINMKSDDNNYTVGGKGYSLGSLDIIAHEYAHAMNRRLASRVPPFGEGGAVIEGYCDVFGMLTKYRTDLNSNPTVVPSWKIGEFAADTRYIDNPLYDNKLLPNGTFSFTPSPERHLGANWKSTPYSFNNPTPSGDQDGSEHSNGGVLRKWFYLLSNGTNGQYINGQKFNGIGISRAEQIAYLSLNWWTPANIDYWMAANGTKNAIQMHGLALKGGYCSANWKANRAAWMAVGIDLGINNISCKRSGIAGPDVVGINNNTVSTSIFTPENLEEEIQPNTQYDWTVPNGWGIEHVGENIKLVSVQNFNSAILKLKCTYQDGSIENLEKIIHFSDIKLAQDNFTINGNNKKNNNVISITPKEITNLVSIYPNPINSNLTIETQQKVNLKVSITNALGILIFDSKYDDAKVNIDCSQYPNGIYFVRTLNQDGIIEINKIIIQH
jgi:Zn-dependent metalloprotease